VSGSKDASSGRSFRFTLLSRFSIAFKPIAWRLRLTQSSGDALEVDRLAVALPVALQFDQLPLAKGQLYGGHGASESVDVPFVGLLAQKRPTELRQAVKPVALTEAEAIRLAQAGDAAAFEFLYRMHSRRVYALCLRMVGNPADAEDLMQEAFLQLFRKIGTFRGESAFSTWLHRMTVNVVLMRLRKKSLPAASLEETTEPDEETGGPRKDIGAPDLGLSGAVDRVNLERSIEKLPPGYRTVFVLHDVQGYEHNEIADIMGCSVGNSKSQLHKARTRLRELLQEDARDQARQERQEAKAQAPDQD